jgi:hypothetical protein
MIDKNKEIKELLHDIEILSDKIKQLTEMNLKIQQENKQVAKYRPLLR